MENHSILIVCLACYPKKEGFTGLVDCPGTIHAGDILLYGNNCVVVFYKTFNTSYIYTKIGKITDPTELEAAVGAGGVEVQFGH